MARKISKKDQLFKPEIPSNKKRQGLRTSNYLNLKRAT